MGATIQVKHKDEKTIVSNGVGEWCFDNMDDDTAIASVVFHTAKRYFQRTKNYSGDFEMKISMEIIEKENRI